MILEKNHSLTLNKISKLKLQEGKYDFGETKYKKLMILEKSIIWAINK